MITINDFQRCEIRIGKILSAERIEGSDKLLKLSVDLGPSSAKASEVEGRDIRQILSGIAQATPEPEALVGRLVPIITNLEPRQMMGLESQGMMLCADNGTPVLLHPAQDVPPGSLVK